LEDEREISTRAFIGFSPRAVSSVPHRACNTLCCGVAAAAARRTPSFEKKFVSRKTDFIMSLHKAAFPSGRKAFKASFQHLHTQGYFCIRQGVTQEALLPLEINAASKKDWHEIHNVHEKTSSRSAGLQQKQKGKGKRSFKAASKECFDLFSEIVIALKNCGLANGHHDIRLARGASWVKSTKGVIQQTDHTDFQAEVPIPPHISCYYDISQSQYTGHGTTKNAHEHLFVLPRDAADHRRKRFTFQPR
jgi:hypothetical protein